MRTSKPNARRWLRVLIQASQYARLLAWHLYDSRFNLVALYANERDLYDLVMAEAEACYREATECLDADYPILVTFDEALADAADIRSEQDAQPGSACFLDVYVYGCYYHDDADLQVPIRLTDEEVDAVKGIVAAFDGVIVNEADPHGDCPLTEQGLLPILREGSEELYRKFYRAVYPHVFCELFSYDELCELDEPDQGVDMSFENIDSLMLNYGDSCDFSETFMVHIPEAWLPE